MLIPEGTSGTFTIDRGAGSVGENTVYWSLSSSGSSDMNQTNGSVVFTDVSLQCACDYNNNNILLLLLYIYYYYYLESDNRYF